jgi:hypothetical protein
LKTGEQLTDKPVTGLTILIEKDHGLKSSINRSPLDSSVQRSSNAKIIRIFKQSEGAAIGQLPQ